MSIASNAHLLRPMSLLDKLVQGEEPHPELFDSVEKSLMNSQSDTDTEVSLASQIMFHLGYLKEADLSLGKEGLVQVINDGLRASHLV